MLEMIRTPDRLGETQKVIGVLGVAPWSTLDFLDVLYKQIKVDKDWHYPRVVCDINTKIPSRGRHFELEEEDFSPYIRENIENLKNQGAEIVVVTCNTAHIYFEKWCDVSGVKVLNIVDECSNLIKKISTQYFDRSQHTTAIFSGYSLWKSCLYQKKMEDNGINVFDLSTQDAELINLVIMDIKKNSLLSDPRIKKNLDNLLLKLKNNKVDSIVFGCTELTKISKICENYVGNIIDSNFAVAQAAIHYSLNEG